jgi:ubiquinone/menaquinone biosynthesis C-methylase UbiE
VIDRTLFVFTLFVAACSTTAHEHGHEHEHEHGHGHEHGPAAGDTKGFHHRFDDAEKWAKRFDDPKRDAWQMPTKVVGYAEVGAGQVVADLGAGTGYFLSHLSKAVGDEGRVLALDVEPNLVAHMKKRVESEGLANVEVREVKPDDPGLEPKSVDVVLIVDTWHHIDDRVTYSRKLRDALRSGGRVVVVDFTMASPMGPPKQHRIPPERVASELTEAGFAASIPSVDLPRQYVVVGR